MINLQILVYSIKLYMLSQIMMVSQLQLVIISLLFLRVAEHSLRMVNGNSWML